MVDPLRITFVSPPPDLSGGQRVIAIHADGLRARGHEVLVVATRRPPPGRMARARGLVAALARGRWPDPPARGGHYDRMQAPLRLLDHPGSVTDADLPDADAVIATWWETAFAVAALSPQKGRKFHFVQHHEVFRPIPAHLGAGSYHLPLRKIVVAGWLQRLMADRYGDPGAVLVPNSVDPGLFHAPPRGRQPAPTVGFMHAAAPFKGTDVALAALARLRADLPGLRVVAFGKAPPGPSLPLPPGAAFFLRPPQESLREIYARCDVFLAASRSEGFGLPILEAMACRCPVVATRTGCAPDVIAEGETGHLADVGDAAGLARGLARVLALSEPDWRRMSDAALARARGYSWDEATDRFEAALRA